MKSDWMKTLSALARIAAGITLTLTISCSSSQPNFEAPYKANVISFTPRTSASDEAWTIDTKELTTLEQPSKVQGKYFEIVTGASIKIDSSTGSLTVATSTNHDRSDLRLENKNGVIIARDTLSLYALSAFHSFEQLFKQLIQVIPVSGEKLFDENGERLKVFLEPSLVERIELVSTVLTPKTNAAFNPERNDFYLFKSSNVEKIPLAANYKVIAHEFGHLIFKKSFDAGRMEKCQGEGEQEFSERKSDKNFAGRWGLEYSISGINEGFADFISYMFTRSTDPLKDAFIASYQGAQDDSRSLEGTAFTFNDLISDEVCSGRFYCIGTLFARALYQIAKNYESQPELITQFSYRVYATMTQVRELFKQSPFLDFLPTPSDTIAKCVRSPQITLPYDGSVLSAFLAAFISAYPDEKEKNALCASFEQLFGELGFKKETRRVCTL
ncbi:MAG: hypothetical protein RJB13_774 [Pseudomonadota bacterium]